jgi:hypothetical protein
MDELTAEILKIEVSKAKRDTHCFEIPLVLLQIPLLVIGCGSLFAFGMWLHSISTGLTGALTLHP